MQMENETKFIPQVKFINTCFAILEIQECIQRRDAKTIEGNTY